MQTRTAKRGVNRVTVKIKTVTRDIGNFHPLQPIKFAIK
jgi:hypothetical protein